AAASATGMCAASTASAAASTASAAASAVAADTYERGCSGVLFVEDIECRQGDVRDFLFTESDFVTHSGAWRYRGGAARQRQRQPGGPQQRHGACTTLWV